MPVEMVMSGNRADAGTETGIPAFFAQPFLHFLSHFVASILPPFLASLRFCWAPVASRESQFQAEAALLGSLPFSAGNYVFLKITF